MFNYISPPASGRDKVLVVWVGVTIYGIADVSSGWSKLHKVGIFLED